MTSRTDAPRTAMRAALLSWFDEHGRAFPWRDVDDPYAVLVLEVMSQQTQLARIEEPWEAFLDRWPTPATLARADRGEVISFWSTHRLGYNRRAGYLHEAASRIVEAWDGEVPTDPEGLETLPGVGPYTARAVASFAFETDCAVIDTNVERVLHRAFAVDERSYRDTADALLPEGQSAVWNSALMDLGATVCTPTPACDEAPCPWREWCVAYEHGEFDVPTGRNQPSFEGSRRQYRGRIVRTLASSDPLTIEDLGAEVAEDFGPDGTHDRDWLVGILRDLAADGLVVLDAQEGTVALP